MCTALDGARRLRRRGTTTEMRISEVEIISTLTPASASASKNFAETPGCERMPAPIRETLPIWSSYCSDSKPTASLSLLERGHRGLAPSVLGSVKEMSVRPVAAAETFCTIMSMLISASASARKIGSGLARLVGDADDGDLASLRSWATPEMIACSIGLPPASLPRRRPGALCW